MSTTTAHQPTTDADGETLLKVSKTSSVHAVATAISKSIFESQSYPTLRAIGHGAVGQAVKAVAIARGYVAPRGIDLAFTVGFESLTGDNGDEISAISIQTFRRS